MPRRKWNALLLVTLLTVSTLAASPTPAEEGGQARGPAPLDDPPSPECNFTWLRADGVGSIGSTAMYIHDGDLDIFVEAFPASGTNWDPSTVTDCDIIIAEDHGHGTHYDPDTVAMVQQNTGAIVVGNTAVKNAMLNRGVPAGKIVELSPSLGGTDSATNVAGCDITAIGMYHTMATTVQVDTYYVEMPSGIRWFHGTCAASACYASYIKNRALLDDLDMMALDFEHNFNTAWDEKRPNLLFETHTFSTSGEGYYYDEDPSSVPSPRTRIDHNGTYHYVVPGPNLPPVLSLGSASPLDVTEDDTVTFGVTYADPNDDAPGARTVLLRDGQGHTTEHTLMIVASSQTWIDGRQLQYSTKLSPGTYQFRFNATDGDLFATGDIGWNPQSVTVRPRNKVPELQSPFYKPSTGDTGTIFRFEVMYRDGDDQAPAGAQLFIDGTPHGMVTDATSGPWDSWTTFYCETTLGVGANHRYYFLFSDGEDQTRLPLASASPNWYLGPEVELPNLAPDLTTAQHMPQRGDRDTEFTFSVIYTDAEGDRPIVSFVHIDGVGYIMRSDSFDYASGVRYYFTTRLDVGSHQYHFSFADDGHPVRLPPTGSFEGPEVDNRLPVAVISGPGNGTRFAPDDLVPLRSSGSTDPDGDDITFAWTSDRDGVLGSGPSLDVSLSEGTHTVSLEVTDTFDGTRMASITLEVRPYLPRPFIGGIEVNDDRPIEGDLVRVTAYVGNDGEAKATGLIVQFLVDGTVEAEETVSLEVDATVTVSFTWRTVPGTHTLRAAVMGDAEDLQLEVAANTPPTAEPRVANEGARFKVGEDLLFKPYANDEDRDALAFLWDFGDGTNSTKDSPNHAYAGPGEYTVTLTVMDPRGGQAVQSFQVVVHEPEQEDESPGPGALLAVAALALLAIWLDRRVR